MSELSKIYVEQLRNNLEENAVARIYFRRTTVFFQVYVTVHRDKFRIIKPTRCTEFSILFCNEILHVSDSSSVHHNEIFTVHTAMVYVIQVCGQLASRIRMKHSNPACKVSAKLYDIYRCCVYSKKLLIMDRGTVRNM